MTFTTPATFCFNLRFTRADENDAVEHVSGFSAVATDLETAEWKTRRWHDHLNVREVRIFAVVLDDGRRIYPLTVVG